MVLIMACNDGPLGSLLKYSIKLLVKASSKGLYNLTYTWGSLIVVPNYEVNIVGEKLVLTFGIQFQH